MTKHNLPIWRIDPNYKKGHGKYFLVNCVKCEKEFSKRKDSLKK